jgi:hypothetical protein
LGRCIDPGNCVDSDLMGEIKHVGQDAAPIAPRDLLPVSRHSRKSWALACTVAIASLMFAYR